MRERRSTYLFSAALLASTALSLPSVAWAATPAPQFPQQDANDVDMTTGLPWLQIEEGGIGTGPGRVAMQRVWAGGAGFVDNWTSGLYQVSLNGTQMFVQIAGVTADTFSGSGTNWTNDRHDGATLTVDAQSNWIYTESDGTQIQFSSLAGESGPNCPGADSGSCRVPEFITKPSGLKFSLAWDEATVQQLVYRRLTGVSSSAGYSASITYQSSTATAGMDSSAPWFTRTQVSFNNIANPPSPVPTIIYAHPDSTTLQVSDPGSRTWTFTTDANGRLIGVRRPGSSADNVTYVYGTNGAVSTATKDGIANTYVHSVALALVAEQVTNPLGKTKTVGSTGGQVIHVQDELGRSTDYEYTNRLLTKITFPEGNSTTYTYDSRGNVTTTTQTDKSGALQIVTSATFDATCTNVVTCNEPNTTTDAKGNVTDYTYDPTHGGVTTITAPAPVSGGVRPQTRFGYTAVTSALGGTPVYMLTSTKACPTGATCTTANEVAVTIGYNSNLLPTTVTRGNTSGTLAATTTFTYGARGNLGTEDGPLAGTTDTTVYKYDSADQLVGIISPDPDGAGSLQNRAIRITYRPDGQVSKQEAGTTAGQTAANWTAFAPLETVDTTFDANSRPVTKKLSASGTAYALTQTDYDALGRVHCTALRNNTAAYASLPSSACIQTSGNNDQIVQFGYDDASEVTDRIVGVGVAAQTATERHLTYNPNGTLATLTDANGNVTGYSYDGFDRLSGTTYPVPQAGGTAPAEQFAYDVNSNVSSHTLRDGSVIQFTYDNLNRVTLKDLPGTEPSVSYAYDNLGRLTSASETGNSMSFTYDALSRKLTEVGPQGTVTSGYDLAGRRTSIAYPTATGATNLAVTYNYLTTGEVSGILDGTTSLATYAYDDLGNRTSATLGNGVAETYAYNPVSRLTTLTNDLAGTADDLTIGGSTTPITYSPAGQILSAPRSNGVYSWTGATAVNRAYSINGLNQYIAAGAASFTYDTKGNLTSDGTNSFCYSSENLLTGKGGTCAAPTVALSYDPWMRLYQVAGTTTTRFAYDRLNLIADYNGSNALQHRYVFGPGVDEPIVEYSSTGARTYLSSDERRSIVARSNATGTLVTANTYDEYGIPGSGNAGLFQYTGQAWISQLGMYYYKARVYSPTLGRFMQTDPIGPADNTNLYAYAHNDPVNKSDPLGLGCPTLGVSNGNTCDSGPPPPDPIIVTGTRVLQVVSIIADPVNISRLSLAGFALPSLSSLVKNIFKPDPCNGKETPRSGPRMDYNLDDTSQAFQDTLNFKFDRHTNGSARSSQFDSWVDPLVLQSLIGVAIQGSPQILNNSRGGVLALRYVFDVGRIVGTDRDLGPTRYITVGVTVIGNEGRLNTVYPGCK